MPTDAAEQRAWRAGQRQAGLCYDCGKAALPGATRCEKHAAANREAQARHKASRRLRPAPAPVILTPGC